MSTAEKTLMWRRRREEIADKLTADLSQSDRAVARETGAHPDTVGEVRREVEASVGVDSPRRPHSMYTPVYPPDHKASQIVHIGWEYPFESDKPPRTRDGDPYPRETEQKEWPRDIILGSPVPCSLVDFDACLVELVNHLRREIRADPLLTMLR